MFKIILFLFFLFNVPISFSQVQEYKSPMENTFERLNALGINSDSTLNYTYSFHGNIKLFPSSFIDTLKHLGFKNIEISFSQLKFYILVSEEAIHNPKTLLNQLYLFDALAMKYGIRFHEECTGDVWRVSKLNGETTYSDETLIEELKKLDNLTLYNRALKLEQVGYDRQAIIAFEMCITRNFKIDTCYLEIGNSQIKIGNNLKGIEAYNKAIELNKKYVKAYHSLGTFYFNNNDLQKAESNFMKVIELDSKNKEGYNERVFLRLGLSFYYLQNYNKAKKYFQKTLDINPKNVEAIGHLRNIEVYENE